MHEPPPPVITWAGARPLAGTVSLLSFAAWCCSNATATGCLLSGLAMLALGVWPARDPRTGCSPPGPIIGLLGVAVPWTLAARHAAVSGDFVFFLEITPRSRAVEGPSKAERTPP